MSLKGRQSPSFELVDTGIMRVAIRFRKSPIGLWARTHFWATDQIYPLRCALPSAWQDSVEMTRFVMSTGGGLPAEVYQAEGMVETSVPFMNDVGSLGVLRRRIERSVLFTHDQAFPFVRSKGHRSKVQEVQGTDKRRPSLIALRANRGIPDPPPP